MYCSEVVEQRLEAARECNGWLPEYHSIPDIEAFDAKLLARFPKEHEEARLNSVGTEDPSKAFQLSITRALNDPRNPRLNKDEIRFIDNEQALVQCDAAYYLTRYYKIKNRQNLIQHFSFQGGQRILFNVISELERMGRSIEILINKARQLGMCLHPDTRVLTSDLRWIRIDDAKPGDKLIGCDENFVAKWAHRHLLETVVEARRDVFKRALRITMEDGREITATPEHRFLCKKRKAVDTEWRQVGEMLVGDLIRGVSKTWSGQAYEDGWFGGLLDGEGSLRKKSRAGGELCVSQVEGAVLERARKYLTDNGFAYREDWDRREPSHSSKLGKQPVCKLTIGRIDEIFRLIGKTRPSRLLTKEFWQGKEMPGKRIGGAWVKIVKVEEIAGQQRMVDLQTSTKTFIAEGLVSHNSTLVQGLIGHKAEFFYGTSGVVASADKAKTGEMVKMMLMGYDMQPWWLRPLTSRRVESQNGMITWGAMNSGISFQHGNQVNPIAMGSTPITYHLCLSGRTLVRVSDGRLLPISEVRPGDSIISESGSSSKVLQSFVSPRKNEITAEIRVKGTPSSLSCTRDHLVMTDHGWKQASEVRRDDRLIYPVRPISKSSEPIVMGMFNKHQRRVIGEKNSRLEEKEFEPTFDLGRLVGLFLAEGSIQVNSAGQPSAIYYTIHEDEVDTVESWCRSVFGPELRATLKRKNSKTAQVVLNRRGFGVWLVENFGEKDDKRISDKCWSWGEEFCRGLAYGYIFGDGHYATRDNSIYATSVRSAITFGLRELIASLGFGWSQVAYREGGLFYNRNCRPVWILTIVGETAELLRRQFGYTVHPTKESRSGRHWEWHRMGISLEIDEIADGFSSEFYDIEVDHPSHQFLTACGIVHNSEVSSFYDAAYELIDVGLFKCVHPSRHVLGFLESTAKGNTGYWADTYWGSKAGWEKGTSRLMALFLPFFCADDMYPNPTELETHPAPESWRPEPETRQMVAESELYVKSNPILEKVLKQKSGLPGDWKMPREKAWYWEWNFLEARGKGREKDWYQEVAHTDKASFQGSYDNVFGREVITEAWSNRDTKYSVYGIVGQSIQERHEPDPEDVDNTLPRITVKRDNRKGEPFQWEFVPLFWEEPFKDLDDKELFENESHMGKLFVWMEPEPGYDYSIGVDTSKGVGKDGTVVAVSRRGRSPSERDIQAAEWRDNYVSHVEAWSWVLAIASYYSRYMGQHGVMFREPYVAIEQIEAVGDTCQDQMSLCGYSRFHRMIRYDSMPKQMKKSKAHKRGWFTSGWSRPMLTDGFVVNTQNGWYQVNSPYTIWEMDHWEVHYTRAGTKEKFEHGEDTTDDGIFANALASFCPNDRKMQADRSENKFRQATSRVPELDLTPTKSGYFVPETGYPASRDKDIRKMLSGSVRGRH